MVFFSAVWSREPTVPACDRFQSGRLHRGHTNIRPGWEPVRAGDQIGADSEPGQDPCSLE